MTLPWSQARTHNEKKNTPNQNYVHSRWCERMCIAPGAWQSPHPNPPGSAQHAVGRVFQVVFYVLPVTGLGKQWGQLSRDNFMSCLTLAAWINKSICVIIKADRLSMHITTIRLSSNLTIHCYALIYLQRAATYQGSMCNYRVANGLMLASVTLSGSVAKFTDRIWF